MLGLPSRAMLGDEERQASAARGDVSGSGHAESLYWSTPWSEGCSWDRRGMPVRAPSSVHLTAATTVPSFTAAPRLAPTDTLASSEPRKASPAPVVSMTP